ncbi:hypothetical protein [Pelagibacterium halotolerans]|uniref:hypothetical protein n=1 Tax=Pelagibacterium halotolerans TaxID=531813 RepID=UPI00384C609F
MRRYTVKDWLQVHALERDTVLSVLDAIRLGEPSREGEYSKALEIDADLAWQLCAKAVLSAMPVLEADIVRIRDHASRRFGDASAPITSSFTLDNGAERLPHLECPYSGTAGGLLILAHEFAHAVQIVASDGKFIPPMTREVCAFLGELMLIEHVRTGLPSYAEALLAAWRADTATYLGEDADALLSDLIRPNAAYTYRWNYPVARWIAGCIWGADDKELVLRVFTGRVDAPELIGTFCKKLSVDPINPLPPFPLSASGQMDAAQIYRQIGAVALLDLEDWQNKAQTSIQEYYAFLLDAMREGHMFIKLDDAQRPAGYVTWDYGVHEGVALTHECAPFGDEGVLHDALVDHFSKATRADSFRSAQAAGQPA